MRIFRHGASAYHGISNIDLKKVSVSWNEKECAIEIKSAGIRDFNTESSHDYRISIPLADLAKIIKSLGNDGVANSATEIEAALDGELKALNRIVAAASGLTRNAENIP
jgi:hypothetical protein